MKYYCLKCYHTQDKAKTPNAHDEQGEVNDPVVYEVECYECDCDMACKGDGEDEKLLLEGDVDA